MKYLDSSILVAALQTNDAQHEPCARLLSTGGEFATSSHALLETFSILTGGSSRPRVTADDAIQLLEENVGKSFQIVSLSPRELFQMMKLCRARGVRGGAIYDFQHLAAANKAGAKVLHTLDVGEFRAFAREGDPKIEKPS
ncbi:type II toxin-antitoxin system VapC family toxin [Luteolibacter sp. Populi]|uniref:type II toxin-antitoxin system VapC family toxin n=1 Tax=Luteolibacter sp. Populi TaxID=3230487 RepID=UPI0034671665